MLRLLYGTRNALSWSLGRYHKFVKCNLHEERREPPEV